MLEKISITKLLDRLHALQPSETLAGTSEAMTAVRNVIGQLIGEVRSGDFDEEPERPQPIPEDEPTNESETNVPSEVTA